MDHSAPGQAYGLKVIVQYYRQKVIELIERNKQVITPQ